MDIRCSETMLWEIGKVVLFRIWLGPIVKGLFDGVAEVIDGCLKCILKCRPNNIKN